MKQAVVLMAIAALWCGADPRAQQQSLSDIDVAAAIAAGAREKDKRHGLVLRDSAQSSVAAFAGANPPGSNGFSLEAFTPTTWIRQLAADFAREYHVLTVNNLPLDAKDAVLRLIIETDSPTQIAAKGMSGTSSVQHVVLRNKTKTIVIQPLTEEPFDREVKNATGGAVTFTSLRATFNLDALQEIRGPQHRDSVFITVIGSSGEKDFEVTNDQFGRLP